MTVERRERWNCCQIMHGGDGPETSIATDILGVNDITAEEAAQCYAEERMGDVNDDRDYGDGDSMHVAVYVRDGRWQVFHCYKNLTVSINTMEDDERSDLVETRNL